ncbi:MAG: YdcF family protein [Oligoflexales bacterium]|nr:YdcF family protein [Oligoflexales bacterium]
MIWHLKAALKALALPPGSLIILFLLACFFLYLKKKRTAKSLVIIFITCFYVLSTPYCSKILRKNLEDERWVFRSPEQAQAIVILGAGKRSNAIEYGEADTVSNHTLERLTYGAFLQKKTGLPILVSGGTPEQGQHESEATVMAQTLKNIFGISVAWEEGKSNNTQENALFVADILKKLDITTVLLVTEAWHMRRSILAFQATELKIIPAATNFSGQSTESPLLLFLPRATALEQSTMVIHELLGLFWYQL